MAAYHPQVVHFVIGLLVAGVLFRVISLAGRPAFLSPAATTLLLAGAIAAVVAVQSGVAAHGPVERIPGARAAVVEHEEWGIGARNAFLVVAVLELIGLALRRSPRRRWVHAAAAVMGIVGLYPLYQAGEHGGTLVYSYAGGVGIRSGDPRDVERLLVAGLYQQAQQERQAGRSAEAATLMDTLSRRAPDDAEIQLLLAESLIVDRRDLAAALAVLDRIPQPSAPFLRLRLGTLRVDALEASGQQAAALETLESLAKDFPSNPRVQARLAKMKSSAPSAGQ